MKKKVMNNTQEYWSRLVFTPPAPLESHRGKRDREEKGDGESERGPAT